MADSTPADTTPAAGDGATGATAPGHDRRGRGTTALSRLSGVMSWFVGTWFCFYGIAYLPLLIAGVLVIWLGIGAWKGRPRRTAALAAVTALAAVYYPVAAWWRWNHRSGDFGEFSYPGLWITMLAIQSALLVTIAVTAALSLRVTDRP
jgi:hypothetical protein